MIGQDQLDDLPYWPDGASEWAVRRCGLMGCEHCRERVRRLDDYKDGIAPDGEHAALSAYTDGSQPEVAD